MHDAQGVQRLNSETHLRQDFEDDLLSKHLVLRAHTFNAVRQVTAVCVLHHQAESMRV